MSPSEPALNPWFPLLHAAAHGTCDVTLSITEPRRGVSSMRSFSRTRGESHSWPFPACVGVKDIAEGKEKQMNEPLALEADNRLGLGVKVVKH